MASTEKTVVGLVLAFAAGAVVGLLWAPAAGERTRKTLAKKGGALGNTIGDRATTAWRNAGALVAKGRRKISA
jgi:gas vesicle protein